MKHYLVNIALGYALVFPVMATDAPDYLSECWNKQGEALEGRLLLLDYSEDQNKFYHSPEPWQVMNYKSTGRVWCGAGEFAQVDTIARGEKHYVSKKQWRGGVLLEQPYWSKEPAAATQSTLLRQPVTGARYSPVALLRFFLDRQPAPEKEVDAGRAIYTLKVDDIIVRLYIRTADYLLEQVSATESDNMWGDVTTLYRYNDYFTVEGLSYPRQVENEKLRGVKDHITLNAVRFINEPVSILDIREGYTAREEEKEATEVKVERLADHIYGINMFHAGSRAVVVEFNDFLTVVEAPLSSENGELVIAEARKLAPQKPIRYYAFGHHHPWYLGGVRPFIHKGVTVITVPEDLDYLRFIASAPHTLEPDSLQLQPKALSWEVMEDSQKTIEDGTMRMDIYRIGKKSAHTNDYLVFYFPAQRLLLEGDLTWIPLDGTVKKASERQAGLYQAIRERGLEVDTIVQSWPVNTEEYKCKAVFPFSDLEKSMNAE